MHKICLTIEYDGTRYAGWQVQDNGESVQQVVEQALFELIGQRVRLHSSGRTDAGVHARGMVAHFRTDRDLPMSAYRDGVNGYLPPDVAIVKAQAVDPGFHARFDARGKWYRYTMCLQSIRSPLMRNRAWQVRGELDVEAMASAASRFVGEHDFSAFRTSRCDAKTTVRTVYAVTFLREGDLLHIDVKGSGFLRNMVRLLVGALVEIGLGKQTVDDLRQKLSVPQNVRPGLCAPPHGLCLMEVWY